MPHSLEWCNWKFRFCSDDHDTRPLAADVWVSSHYTNQEEETTEDKARKTVGLLAYITDYSCPQLK